MENRPREPRRRWAALRDLLVISLAAVALLWAGAAFQVADGIHGWLMLTFPGQEDDVLIGFALAALGFALFSVLRSVEAGRQARARSEAEVRYRALIERMPVVTYTWDPRKPAGTLPPPYVSPQVEAILGFSPEEWQADPQLWIRQIHRNDQDRVLAASARADRTGEPFSIEYRHQKKDGTQIWVREEAVVVERDASGAPTLVQGVMYDITERRRAQEHVAEAEARYRTLVERVPAVTYIWDASAPNGTVPAPYISPQIEHLLGYTPEEFDDPTLWDRLVHPDDRDRVLEEWAAIERGAGAFRSEYRMYRKDKQLVWIRDEAVPVSRDEQGHPIFQGVMFDITERKETERRLLEAEERFRTLVEQIPAITYVEGPTTGDLLYISPQIERVLGYTPEEWTADRESWFRTLHPDDRERVVAEDRRTDDTGEPFSVEYRQIAKDGRMVWTRDEAVLVRDDRGEPMFWQGVRFDISAQKRTEEQLREAEGRYRTLVENLPAVTYIDAVDERSTTVYVSPQVQEMFGYTPAEWRANPELWIDALHPSDRGRVLEAARLHNTTGVPFEVEYRFRASDGTWRWIRDQAVVVRDDDGRIVLSQGVMFDVTERLLAEAQLRETEAKYRAIVEHVPAAIYVDEPDGSMSTTYVSPQIQELMGITPDEYRADPEIWLTLMAPEHRDEIRRTYLEAVDEQRSWVGEYRIRTPDGRDVWIHDETSFVTDEAGKPLFLQGVMFDITERKLAEQALQESERQQREAAERLRALDDMKNTFLAAVSHELRSPLTSILGFSLTLEQTELPEEDRADLLGRLAANARKLDRLLKDLLDIDRLSRGIVTPKYQPTDLGGLVRRTVESLDVLRERSILVETESVVVPVDPAKVERIVENLLMNAVRHTTADTGIWVRVWSQGGGVMLAVEDDGPGVPPELRDAIFEPFRQGPTASAYSPGTGIGLSLVGMFAELHGGRAWVQEREGGGASFRVFLPATPVETTGNDGAVTPLSRASAG